MSSKSHRDRSRKCGQNLLNVHVDSNLKSRQSFVVNLEPGQYKVHLDLKRSKNSPIRISLTPGKPEFPPPKRPEELYYLDYVPYPTPRWPPAKLQRHAKRKRWGVFCFRYKVKDSNESEFYGYDGSEHLMRAPSIVPDAFIENRSKKRSHIFSSSKILKQKFRSGLQKIQSFFQRKVCSTAVGPVENTGSPVSEVLGISHDEVSLDSSDNRECEADSEDSCPEWTAPEHDFASDDTDEHFFFPIRSHLVSKNKSCDDLSEQKENFRSDGDITCIQSFSDLLDECYWDTYKPYMTSDEVYESSDTLDSDDNVNFIFYNEQFSSLKAAISIDSLEVNKILSEGLIIISQTTANSNFPECKFPSQLARSQAEEVTEVCCPKLRSRYEDHMAEPFPERTKNMTDNSEQNCFSNKSSTFRARRRHSSVDFESQCQDEVTKGAEVKTVNYYNMGNGQSVDKKSGGISDANRRKPIRKKYLNGIRDAFNVPLSRSHSTSDSFLSIPKKSYVRTIPTKSYKRSSLSSNLADIVNRRNLACQKAAQCEQKPTTFNENNPLGSPPNLISRIDPPNPLQTDTHVYENTNFRTSCDSPITSSASSGSFTLEPDDECIFQSVKDLKIKKSPSEDSLSIHYEDLKLDSISGSPGSEDSGTSRFFTVDGPTFQEALNSYQTVQHLSDSYQDMSYYFNATEAVEVDDVSDHGSEYKSFYFSTLGEHVADFDEVESNASYKDVDNADSNVYENEEVIRYAYSSPLRGQKVCGVKSSGWASSDSMANISTSYASRQYKPEHKPLVTKSAKERCGTTARSASIGSTKPPKYGEYRHSLSSGDVTSESLSYDSEDTFFSDDICDTSININEMPFLTTSLSSSGSSINLKKPPVSLSSSGSSINVKKPPVSPGHDAPRRRCRSVSNSRRMRPDRARPVSLVTPRISVSQESLDDYGSSRMSYLIDRAPTVEWLAEDRKSLGNEYYSVQKYHDAETMYTQAIELCPDCAAYYSNRSACYMMLGKYAEALTDAKQSVRLNAAFVKGYLRVGKCHIALGDAEAALVALKKGFEIEPTKAIRDEIANAESLQRSLEEVRRYINQGDYRPALYFVENALKYAVGSRSLTLTKAECCVYACRYEESNRITIDISRLDANNADAVYIRGLCLYHQEQQDQALNRFQLALRLAPEHKKAREAYKKCKLLKEKKNAGNAAFQKLDFATAAQLYSEGLEVDPSNKAVNAKLYYNRSIIRFRLGQYDAALEDCDAAISRDEKYVKARLKRAQCYQKLEKHEEAVKEYESIQKVDANNDYRDQIREAKFLLKKSKRKDYYKILGVQKDASDRDIKKAYQRKAMEHHPDRHVHAEESERRRHEEIFKEVKESHSVLTDAQKKQNYDAGRDVDNNESFFDFRSDDPLSRMFKQNHGGFSSFGGHTFHFNNAQF